MSKLVQQDFHFLSASDLINMKTESKYKEIKIYGYYIYRALMMRQSVNSIVSLSFFLVMKWKTFLTVINLT